MPCTIDCPSGGTIAVQDIVNNLNQRVCNSGDVMTGNLTINTSTPSYILQNTGSGIGSEWHLTSDSIQKNFSINTLDGSTFVTKLTIDSDAGKLYLLNSDIIYSYNGTDHKIWNEGNDGSGSGLDADLLDGKQSTEYIQTDGSNAMIGSLKFDNIGTSGTPINFNDIHSISVNSGVGNFNINAGCDSTQNICTESGHPMRITLWNDNSTNSAHTSLLISDKLCDAGDLIDFNQFKFYRNGNIEWANYDETEKKYYLYSNSGHSGDDLFLKIDGTNSMVSSIPFSDSSNNKIAKIKMGTDPFISLSVNDADNLSSEGPELRISKNVTSPILVPSIFHSRVELFSNSGENAHFFSTGNIVGGYGTGSVGFTVNDGGGNSNVTFNHVARKPEQDGKCGRIVVNTDNTNTSDLSEMQFQIGTGSKDTSTDLVDVLKLTKGGDNTKRDTGLVVASSSSTQDIDHGPDRTLVTKEYLYNAISDNYERIIYVKDTGDNNNDGLSVSTPVKTFRKAVELCRPIGRNRIILLSHITEYNNTQNIKDDGNENLNPSPVSIINKYILVESERDSNNKEKYQIHFKTTSRDDYTDHAWKHCGLVITNNAYVIWRLGTTYEVTHPELKNGAGMFTFFRITSGSYFKLINTYSNNDDDFRVRLTDKNTLDSSYSNDFIPILIQMTESTVNLSRFVYTTHDTLHSGKLQRTRLIYLLTGSGNTINYIPNHLVGTPTEKGYTVCEIHANTNVDITYDIFAKNTFNAVLKNNVPINVSSNVTQIGSYNALKSNANYPANDNDDDPYISA